MLKVALKWCSYPEDHRTVCRHEVHRPIQYFEIVFFSLGLYFGQIKRHNTLEKLLLEGTCEGRRGRGRPRRRWTQDIGKWVGVSTVEAGRQALERGEFRQAVWEATSIKDPP